MTNILRGAEVIITITDDVVVKERVKKSYHEENLEAISIIKLFKGNNHTLNYKIWRKYHRAFDVA